MKKGSDKNSKRCYLCCSIVIFWIVSKNMHANCDCYDMITNAAYDELNKFFSASGMPIASSHYWNNIHGNNAEEAI